MRTSFKKYFRVYKCFFENAVSYFFQYRQGAIVNLIFNIVWMLVIFLSIEIFFGNTTLLAGWTRGETYLLSLFWMLSDEICIFFFSNNLYRLAGRIVEGNLDPLLTKPINTLFLVSTEYVGIRSITRIVTYFGVGTYVIMHFQLPLTWLSFSLGFLFLLCGVIIQYAVLLLLNTLNFWFEKIDNINALWDTLTGAGKYPLDIFKKTLRILFMTMLPIAYLAYFPTTATLGHISWVEIVIIPIITIVLLVTSVALWNFALRKYTSASS